MKYVMAQPSVPRFEWEIRIAVHQLKKIGIKSQDIVVLFSKHDKRVIENIRDEEVQVFAYEDLRPNKDYIPSLKPYLMYRFLEESPKREKESYFYMDSDVLLKEKFSDVIPLKDEWLGSNCNGYLNYDYILQCRNGDILLREMAQIVGVSEEEIKNINNNCIGAQYIITEPNQYFFKKVYEDSVRLWRYVKNKDTNFQKWIVEMVSTLWNMLYFGIKPKAIPEMNFSWPTDDIARYQETKIFHNAGVTSDKELFFKGKYVQRSPFDDDLSYVRKDKASYAYVKAIQEVAKMAKYQVIAGFRDKETDKEYFKDKPYPRPSNKKVSKKRIEELTTSNNNAGKPLIKKVEE